MARETVMILLAEARKLVMESARELDTETVGLKDCLGRILAQDVVSDVDMPPFDKSAMDGYACSSDEVDSELQVVETIPAGKVPEKSIARGECAKIMTGAIVPKGAGRVIMVEHTEAICAERVRIGQEALTSKSPRLNIAYRGEDIAKGKTVFRKGERIHTQHVAMLASVGCVEPLVFRRPRVGIVATGNELVEPVEAPGAAQIRNSNSYQLWAQVIEAGAVPSYYGIARDTDDAIDRSIKKGLAENDLLLVSGGVSMGDFDLVPDILQKNGVELLFEKIAVKPGKPTVFGRTDKTWCFGLPGNPVSTFVIFEILTKPFLYKLMGLQWKPPVVRAELQQEYRRKQTEREAWLPVAFVAPGAVRLVEQHGSGHTYSLCPAEGLISVPVGVARLEKGAGVDVRLLP